jgi:hypothetical protein
MAYKKPPAAGGAADTGIEANFAKRSATTIAATRLLSIADRLALTHRIGHLRQQRALGCAGLEAAAGRLIDRNPAFPRPASLVVDRLTHARDLALWEGRA